MMKLGMYNGPEPVIMPDIRVGMMVQNEVVGVVGRVVYTEGNLTAVQEFSGKVHEVHTDDCKEVDLWTRVVAWTHIARKLRRFFVRRIAK